MDTEPGRSLILWTVRASVALYAAAVWLRFSQPSRSNQNRNAYPIIWLLAWIFCIIHVVCAFHFQHRWDHSAALEHTANMTHRVVGIHWGGGLYINYAFLAWWGINALTPFKNPRSLPHQQPDGLNSGRAFHAVAAFMMFNATVVFGPSWWMIPTVAYILLIAARQLRSHRQPGTVDVD